MSRRAKISARVTGFAAGLLVTAGLVVAGLIPGSQAAGSARLTIQSLPTGELGVEPTGRFFTASGIEPGGRRDAVRGTATVTNQTGNALAVRLRGVPAADNLDALLRIEISGAGKRVFSGSLGELRRWTKESFTLGFQESAKVEVEAWIPASVRHGYEALSTDLTLSWKTRTVAP